jgi:capsular polysaccharide export protein
MIGITSVKLSRLPGLKAFLNGADCRFMTPWNRHLADQVAGWGVQPSGIKARRIAREENLPCLLLEDGFLRSVEPSEPPLSIIVEQGGLYHDAGRRGRLDELLNRSLTPAQTARADSLIEAWRTARVSKYNHLRDYAGALPRRYVLVADQLRADTSIIGGLAGPESFRVMVESALAENPGCTVIVKAHPLMVGGRKAGHLDPVEFTANPRIRFITEPCSPIRLIEQAQVIYAVTSQLGFEALIHGKPVRTFGMPFYAGRGLTQDDLAAPSWRRPIALAELVHASLVDYPRYINPETGLRCEVETVLEHLRLQKRMRERFPEKVHVVGFSRWKRGDLRRFMAGSRLHFPSSMHEIPPGAPALLWGSNLHAPSDDLQCIRVEDGFLRSVGLGAYLARPLSWCMDDVGIYYDPNRPSRLEVLLSTGMFDETLLTRARALRHRIIGAGITKYNLPGEPWTPPRHGRRIILVPGQVEDDQSLLRGSGHIRTNLQLLQAVRQANPDAWIVYKHHPDVVARLRRGGAQRSEIACLADEVLANARMTDLLDGADEVHTLTSLTGFEALLRGKSVTCYGRPFYAGWGLTCDIEPMPRRKRHLTLDELIAATLILYPTYVSARTDAYTTPERIIDEILAARMQPRRHILPALAAPLLRLRPRSRPLNRESHPLLPQETK